MNESYNNRKNTESKNKSANAQTARAALKASKAASTKSAMAHAAGMSSAAARKNTKSDQTQQSPKKPAASKTSAMGSKWTNVRARLADEINELRDKNKEKTASILNARAAKLEARAALNEARYNDDSYDDDYNEGESIMRNKFFIIPAIVVILCLGGFVVASQAGIIKTFLTPAKYKQAATQETESTQETTTPQETTTVKETTTTTEEETTEAVELHRFVINVNLAYNVIQIYERGELLSTGSDPKDPSDDEYNYTPYIAFSCSPGIDGATPTGTYELGDRSAWCFMVGDVYTQYATRITDDGIMFHSIPYYTENPGDIETNEYNILGYDASSGCIRLNVRDAAWIFNNCEKGTQVNIFYDWSDYGPLNPEPTYTIPTDISQLAGWDPTDVYYSNNPWLSYNAYLTNTSVSLPAYSSVDSLIAAVCPTDQYGNNLANYFYTAGGYYLDTPGTYYTTAYIDIGNLSFSYDLTITITESYSNDSYYVEETTEYSEEAYYTEEDTTYSDEPYYSDETYYSEVDTAYSEDTGYDNDYYSEE